MPCNLSRQRTRACRHRTAPGAPRPDTRRPSLDRSTTMPVGSCPASPYVFGKVTGAIRAHPGRHGSFQRHPAPAPCGSCECVPPSRQRDQAGFRLSDRAAFRLFPPGVFLRRVHQGRLRCVAVTDDAIYVMEGTRASGGAKPTRLLGVMSRSTRFEPAAGLYWRKVTLLGQRSWVHPPYVKQVLAADQEAPAAVSHDVG